MPRKYPLTESELVEAAAKLRRLTDVDTYGHTVCQVLQECCGGSRAYYYHFFNGHLNFPVAGYYNVDLTEEEYQSFLKDHRPYDPAEVYRRGAFVHHVAEVYNWGDAQQEMVENSYRSLWNRLGMEFIVGIHVFEDELFAMTCGVANRYEEGDFTDYDMEAMDALYPHIAKGYQQAASWTRQKRFGGAMAVAVEDHPRALFLFGGDGTMHYANREARMWMQRERDVGGLPMAAYAETVKMLRPWVVRGTAEGPPGWEIRHLPSWPRLDIKQPVLVMGAVGPLPELPLSAREREVLHAMTTQSAEQAAVTLNLSPHTVRTHLKHIYSKLEVSGLGEALTRYVMSAC